MKITKYTASCLLAGLACMMLSVAANASPIELTRSSGAGGWTNGYAYANITPGGGVHAGEFRFTVSVGNDDFAMGSTLAAFCIDVNNTLTSPASYNVADAATHAQIAANLDLIANLYEKHYTDINNGTTSAAFQLALWELVYNPDSRNLSNGSFFAAASSAQTQAQIWLDGLDGTHTGAFDFFVLLPNPAFSSQVLLTFRPSTSVPEPASLALLGLGVLGAGAARRIRKH